MSCDFDYYIYMKTHLAGVTKEISQIEVLGERHETRGWLALEEQQRKSELDWQEDYCLKHKKYRNMMSTHSILYSCIFTWSFMKCIIFLFSTRMRSNCKTCYFCRLRHKGDKRLPPFQDSFLYLPQQEPGFRRYLFHLVRVSLIPLLRPAIFFLPPICQSIFLSFSPIFFFSRIRPPPSSHRSVRDSFSPRGSLWCTGNGIAIKEGREDFFWAEASNVMVALHFLSIPSLSVQRALLLDDHTAKSVLSLFPRGEDFVAPSCGSQLSCRLRLEMAATEECLPDPKEGELEGLTVGTGDDFMLDNGMIRSPCSGGAVGTAAEGGGDVGTAVSSLGFDPAALLQGGQRCAPRTLTPTTARARRPPPRSGSKRSRAAEVHNLSEKRRRSRINEKMKALQNLIPNSNKTDKASMLDEAIEYLKQLQLQVQAIVLKLLERFPGQMLSMRNGLSLQPMYLPRTLPALQSSHIRMGLTPDGGSLINMGVDMMPANQDSSVHGASSQQHMMPTVAAIPSPLASLGIESSQFHPFRFSVPHEEIFEQSRVDADHGDGNIPGGRHCWAEWAVSGRRHACWEAVEGLKRLSVQRPLIS
ncbi:unnamed protein product [Spirodela intermedia]|uniref:BHLH domain-containing protein n=1 Tax=Spirodela intermedia TaxID=51605 RepID=A0A7I8JS13_SPIIN|nr:unnamed protein product [Spirodela intermedia]CAA6672535.1 unnamed protein product [Spirodela intermedia]